MKVQLNIDDIKEFIVTRTDEPDENYDSPRETAYEVLMSLLSFCSAKAGNEAANALRQHMLDLDEPRRIEREAWHEQFRITKTHEIAQKLAEQEEFRAKHPELTKVSFQATWSTPVDETIKRRKP
jgi:hypothetical protein